MSNKEYYLNNNWYTWEELHALGYTKSKPETLTLYNVDVVPVQVVQSNDQDDDYGKLYDNVNHTWVSDINELNLYTKLPEQVKIYTGDSFELSNGYSNSLNSQSVSNVDLDSELLTVSELHDLGKTLYPCVLYSVSDGVISTWYDPITNLYWDNRVGKKIWSETKPVDESEFSGFENWMPPNNSIELDCSERINFVSDNAIEFISSGPINPSVSSSLIGQGILYIDNQSDSILNTSPDIITTNYNLYSTANSNTINNVTYNKGDSISVTRFNSVDDVNSVILYRVNNHSPYNRQVSEVFYYSDAFENSSERVYFNDSVSPCTLSKLVSIGFSSYEPVLSNYYTYDETRTCLVQLYTQNDKVWFNSNWYTLSELLTITDLYTYEATEPLYLETTRSNSSVDLYTVQTNRETTSFSTSSNYKTKLVKMFFTVSSSGSISRDRIEQFVAQPNKIYTGYIVSNGLVSYNFKDTISPPYFPSSTGLSPNENSILSPSVIRNDETPLTPFTGSSDTLYVTMLCSAYSSYVTTKFSVYVQVYNKVTSID